MNRAMNEKKLDERFYLWWHCPQTQNRDMAGVAYYNEDTGDYRLVLNFFPNNDYFLKFVGGTDDHCRYRLIAVKERQGGGGRFFQGEGILNKSTGQILIQAAPFSKLLVVSLDEEDSFKKEVNPNKEVI